MTGGESGFTTLPVLFSEEARSEKTSYQITMTSSSDGGNDPTRVGGVPVYVVTKKERPAALRMIKGPGAPQAYPLELDEIVVGRGNDAHVIIDGDSVSRRHASFTKHGKSHVCADLGSSNGIYVNGNKVESAELSDGDSIQIGDILFVYQAKSGA
jgi:pSer/pThr/pTyr-binding forkhead associated (FHA) protein